MRDPEELARLFPRHRIIIIEPMDLPAATPTHPSSRPRESNSRCPSDILDALRRAGKPLNQAKLLAEMAKAGAEWSERYMQGHLRALVRSGAVIHGAEGYWLSEKASSFATSKATS